MSSDSLAGSGALLLMAWFKGPKDKWLTAKHHVFPIPELAQRLRQILPQRYFKEDEEDIDWNPQPDNPDMPNPEAFDLAAQKLDELNEREWHLGFEIITGDEYAIRENAHDRNIQLDDAAWQVINRDIQTIERNAQKIFVAHGLVFRSEGHTDSGLAGSLWVRYEDHENFELIKDLLDRGEEWNTSSGSIYGLKRSEFLYEGVSDIGQQVIDVSIRLFADDDVKQEITDL